MPQNDSFPKESICESIRNAIDKVAVVVIYPRDGMQDVNWVLGTQ